MMLNRCNLGGMQRVHNKLDSFSVARTTEHRVDRVGGPPPAMTGTYQLPHSAKLLKLFKRRNADSTKSRSFAPPTAAKPSNRVVIASSSPSHPSSLTNSLIR